MHPKDTDRKAYSVDPEEQSDLSLHCLPKNACPKSKDHYGKMLFTCISYGKDTAY